MRVEIFTWGYWFKNVDIDRIEYSHLSSNLCKIMACFYFYDINQAFQNL